jgi:hypothetical protein
MTMDRSLMDGARILVCATALALVSGGCVSDPTSPGSTGVLAVASGDGQVGSVNTPLPAPLVVRARDAGGAAIVGLDITWAVISAAGPGSSLSATTGVTDASGEASVQVTLGETAGGYLIRATADGGSAEFLVVASTAAFGVSIESGDGQVGVSASLLPEPLVALVTSPDGSPAAGVDVTFSVVEGAGASLSETTVTTAPDGTASTSLTLGPSIGRVRVSVSDGVGSATFVNWVCGGDAVAGFVALPIGGDTTVVGTDVGCIQFDAQTAGASYELVVTPTNPSLVFNPFEVFLAGAAAAAPRLLPGPARPLLSRSSTTNRRQRRELQYEWDRRLREIERPLLPRIRERAARGGFALAAVPVVGDTLEFAFSCVSQVSFPGTPSSITGVVTEVSDRAVIVEDTVGAGSFTTAEYQAIASNFDDVIFATDTTYFGSPADIDDNGGRVVLLFSAGVNTMSDVNPNGYDDGIVAGFFCPADLSGSGNQAEMFYLVMPDPTGEYTAAADAGLTKDEVLTFANGTVAHEFQHLINAQTGSGGGFDVWMNEGLSHLAEEVVGHTASGLVPGVDLTLSDYDAVAGGIDAFNTYHIGNWFNLAQYAAAPSDTAGLVMASDPFGPATFRLRGASWSFLRYLLDRFESAATEPAQTRALIQSAMTDSRDAVAAVFGVPFDSLVSDWAMMLAVEDRADVVPRIELQLTSYRLRELYAELALRSTAFPPNGYPLAPDTLDLAVSARRAVNLFSYTGDYLVAGAASGAGPSGIRIGTTGAADDISQSLGVRVAIVRTD